MIKKNHLQNMENLAKLIKNRKKQEDIIKELKALREEIYHLQAKANIPAKSDMPDNVVFLRSPHEQTYMQMAQKMQMMKIKTLEAKKLYQEFINLSQTNTFKALIHIKNYGLNYIVGFFLLGLIFILQ